MFEGEDGVTTAAAARSVNSEQEAIEPQPEDC